MPMRYINPRFTYLLMDDNNFMTELTAGMHRQANKTSIGNSLAIEQLKLN